MDREEKQREEFEERSQRTKKQLKKQLERELKNERQKPNLYYALNKRIESESKKKQLKFSENNQYDQYKVDYFDYDANTKKFKEVVDESKECKKKGENECNIQYRQKIGICDTGDCDPNQYTKNLVNARNVVYDTMFGIENKKFNMIKLNPNDKLSNQLLHAVRSELSKDTSGEFENYVYMVLSIIFTDYQSSFVDYITQVDKDNTSMGKLEDLVVHILDSKHWNYRFLTHYNQTDKLIEFHSFLTKQNTTESKCYVFLTEYILRYYEQYFKNNKTDFCHISLIRIIIDASLYLFSGIAPNLINKENEDYSNDPIAEYLFELSKGEWEYIASEYYNYFTLFVAQKWDVKNKNLVNSKWKNFKIIPVLIDITKESASSYTFYKCFAELSETIKTLFKELKQNIQKEDEPEDVQYTNELCIVGGKKIKYHDENYDNVVCHHLSILMNRNSTNSIFYALNALELKEDEEVEEVEKIKDKQKKDETEIDLLNYENIEQENGEKLDELKENEEQAEPAFVYAEKIKELGNTLDNVLKALEEVNDDKRSQSYKYILDKIGQDVKDKDDNELEGAIRGYIQSLDENSTDEEIEDVLSIFNEIIEKSNEKDGGQQKDDQPIVEE